MTQGAAEPGTSRMVALKVSSDGSVHKPLFMFAGVRGGPDTFRDLAAQLGDERSVDGRPSSADFLLVELPTIVEDIARRGTTWPGST